MISPCDTDLSGNVIVSGAAPGDDDNAAAAAASVATSAATMSTEAHGADSGSAPAPAVPSRLAAPRITTAADFVFTPGAEALLAKLHSSPLEQRWAEDAERVSGLVAREVFRWPEDSECGGLVLPENPSMRCQLGHYAHETRKLRVKRKVTVDKVETEIEEEVNVPVCIFHLVAHGESWAATISTARRLGHGGAVS